MEFRIADTFSDSLARLTGDEQKAVKMTAFDLHLNPASPGLQFHKLDKARDKNFWSVRVNADIRLIVHKSYRDVARLGRKTRLSEPQRQVLFDLVRQELASRGQLTRPMLLAKVTASLLNGSSPYEYLIVDEAQDVGVPELRLLAALAGANPEGLFFAGDLGQRIFQPPFSWKSLGVDVRGRSKTLRINYRTSHQIRSHADKLLPPELQDVDGVAEERKGTVSAFEGAEPVIETFADEAAEVAAVVYWLNERLAQGVQPEEIGMIVRSEGQFARAKKAIGQVAGVPLLTMHDAKGLEFRAVNVMACDDEVIPSQERIEAIVDDADLEDVYNTERHLLYVACTRARDHLLVTGVKPGSEFLEDFLFA
jgi:superfamily I DNA/RNA helicase/mRNA-degrading endonuclease RelE of RelBE toxin-antitoxin system